ncbi:MAG: hypothetical protein LBO09_00785 [Candidatus Peribacteria bacterium]|jgi:hypothetical protein|nr:hypothetical protein [Candidatus Peribacteria bacterium]
MAKEADFYRMVKVMGIYDKKGTPNSLADNTTVQESLSHQGEPYELRFCVKTFYAGGAQRGSTELCGLMTNFKE